MTGRAEVARQQRQLDTTFSRARGLHADHELLSDFVRYLCVLVSGYVEQTTIELLVWRSELERFIVDEYKDALDGIVDLRNRVAHGRYVGVTFSRASEYYVRIKRIVDRVADLVIPRGGTPGIRR